MYSVPIIVSLHLSVIVSQFQLNITTLSEHVDHCLEGLQFILQTYIKNKEKGRKLRLHDSTFLVYVGVWVNSHINSHSLSISIEGIRTHSYTWSIPRNAQ